MMQYILQTVLFQLVFLLVYEVFLRKETFFNLNRAYLLTTAIGSFILPLVKVQAFSKVIPQQYLIELPVVILGEAKEVQNVITPLQVDTTTTLANTFQWQWSYLFWVGVIISFVILLYKLSKIVELIKKNVVLKQEDILLVKLKNSTSAFSFFHYVFIGDKIGKNEQQVILKHELIHVKQKHTLDLVFFEVLRVLFWFNPLIYIYQSKLRVLHEFIADKEALKTQDKIAYYQNLLTQMFDTNNVSFINTFYKKSLIKKRIIMLQKSKSSQLKLAKYLLVIPMIFTMLFYNAAFAQEKDKAEAQYEELSDKELRKKLYNDLVKQEQQIGNLFSLNDEYISASSDKYIKTRVEYYKLQVYFERILKIGLEKDLENIRVENMLKKTKQTYDEYLALKKTQESKDKWETGMRDGKVRMFVNDVDNLTEKEKVRKQKNIEMIEKDKYFHSLILADENNGFEKVIVNKERHDNFIEEVIEIQKDYQDLEVPMAVIDQIPLYSKCVDLPKEEQKKCLSQEVSKYVAENFNTKLAEELGITGRHRIMVIFKIDKEGAITGVRARAPHPDLEKEAARVVASLPKMIPGKHKGKAVVVPYSLPIMFEIPKKSNNSKKE
ncbi:M56 family metallopeptidase [Pontimicrobium sp. IMCC45349]|uniref:M56 family metallopeptidase n=1 Tax=Pontimicrobium sp. IMCC45349 TaxID=3391574 RepID=UPI0039A16D28